MTYAIHDFMTERLELKNTDLLLYALIYNFSQDGNGCFYGSNDYAAKKVNCTRECVNRSLSSLVEKGLLTRSAGFHNGKQTIDYVAIVPDEAKQCDEMSHCDKKSQTLCEKVTAACDEMSHNNKVDIEVKKDISTTTRVKLAEYVCMTEEEHQKLVDKYGDADAKRMIEILDNYKGQSGKKYKSDYRAILGWVADRLEEEKRKRLQGVSNRSAFTPGPRFNSRGETPTVASMRAAAESFQRIADRHAASDIPTGVDFIPAPAYEEPQIDEQL